jgi:tetratricopeptide (TPR) repeat protein
MRIAEKLGEITSLAFASNSRAIISILRGNSGSAIEQFQKALDLYRQADNIHGQAMSYNGLANAYFSRGQWPEADDCYRRAREIFNQTGDVLHQAFADNNLGGIALNQGKLNDALRYYEESLQSLEQIGGSPYVIGALHMNLGATYIRRLESRVQGPRSRVQSQDQATLDSGLWTLDLSEAKRHLTTGEDYFAQANSRDFLPELRRHFATAALVGGDLVEAETQGRQALDLARELTMRGEEGSSLRVLGEIARAQGHNQQAEQHLTESLAVLQEVGDEYEMARTQLSLGKLQLDKGDIEQASTLLESCIAVFERLDAVLDLAAARDLQGILAGAV